MIEKRINPQNINCEGCTKEAPCISCKNIKFNLTDEQIEIIKESYSHGFTNTEVALDTEIDFEQVIRWRAFAENDDVVKRIQQKPIMLAKKKFHDPKDHREAESFLKRHPATKTDYSDRIEHTGKDGEELVPVLVQFIDGTENNKDS